MEPATIPIEDVSVRCVGCQTPARVSATGRLPRGWKSVPATLCPDCMRSRYLIRAVTVPIAGPIDATWAELGAALRDTWSETTRCANWLVTQLYVRDVRREPGDTKLRPMPRVYLYPEARAAFPRLTPIHLTALIQQVERTYREQRYELLWTGARSLAVHRYPVPFPLHTQGYELEPGASPMVVRVRLGDRWWRLRLRQGAEFARQGKQLRALQSGEALRAAGALYAIAASAGDHRPTPQQRVMLKLVGWFPRPAPRTGDVLRVATSGSSLLVARRHGHGIVATVDGDHIRRAIAGYTVQRTRLTATVNVARRMIPRERAAIHQRLETLGHRHRRALRTWLQQSAAAIVQYARAHEISRVEYEDEVQDFSDVFPWQALRLSLQHAVEGAGLTWQYASGDAQTRETEALAEDGS